MAKELILIRITGEDRPGLTASVMSILARYDVTVLDIGQADIHSTLSLGILVRVTEDRSGHVMKELLFKASELGVNIKFFPVDADDYEAWVKRQGKNRYILARKSVKLYMKDVVKCETQSITTAAAQTLYINGEDAEFMRGKRVLIVDDVISTGGSLASLENLVTQSGGEIVGKMAILAEGDAIDRKDITYLAPLPLFDKEGKAL